MAKSFSIFARLVGKDESAPVMKGLGKIRASAKSAVGAFKGLSSVTGIVGSVGTALAGSAIGKFLLDYTSSSEEIGNLSAQIGISAEALQELRFAADMADISVEEIDGALQKFSVSLGQARAGTGKLASFIQRVDPTGKLLKQFRNAASTEDAFDLAVRSMEKVQDPSRRAALAVALFGKEVGPKMARLAGEGAAGLKALREEARKYGIRSNESIRDAQRFEDSFKRLKRAAKGWFNVAAAQIVPELEPLIRRATAWLLENKAQVKAWIGEAMDRVKQAFAWIRDHWDEVIAGVKLLAEVWIGVKLAGALSTVLGTVREVAGLFRLIGQTRIPALPGAGPGGGAGGGGWLSRLINPATVAIAGAAWATFSDTPAEVAGAIAKKTGGSNPFINPIKDEWANQGGFERVMEERRKANERRAAREAAGDSWYARTFGASGESSSEWNTLLAGPVTELVTAARKPPKPGKARVHVVVSDERVAVRSVRTAGDLDVRADAGRRAEFDLDGEDDL